MEPKELNETQRWAVLARYLTYYDPATDRLPSGTMKKVMEGLPIEKRQVYNYIKLYFDQVNTGIVFPDLAPKKLGNVGVHSDLNEELADCIIEYNSMEGYDMTIREFTHNFCNVYGIMISHSTMHNYMTILGMKLRRSYIKPKLTKSHKIARLRFVLSNLIPNEDYSFSIRSLNHVIHTDEKWFYAKRQRRLYRQHPQDIRKDDESTIHKSHIEKVMFIAVVGVPQYSLNGEFFDGKIGIFPVVRTEIAQRRSKNRPRGAEVLKLISLNAEEYYNVMTRPDGILSKVKAKMPWLKESGIVIQHDGASPHNGKGNDARLLIAGQENNWNITFITQPAQSPDLNKLDLCLFNSMQREADRIKGDGTSIDVIIERVSKEWEAYDHMKLTRAHALWHVVFRCILENEGSNQYQLPHTGITARQNQGLDPVDTHVSR